MSWVIMGVLVEGVWVGGVWVWWRLEGCLWGSGCGLWAVDEGCGQWMRAVVEDGAKRSSCGHFTTSGVPRA